MMSVQRHSRPCRQATMTKEATLHIWAMGRVPCTAACRPVVTRLHPLLAIRLPRRLRLRRPRTRPPRRMALVQHRRGCRAAALALPRLRIRLLHRSTLHPVRSFRLRRLPFPRRLRRTRLHRRYTAVLEHAHLHTRPRHLPTLLPRPRAVSVLHLRGTARPVRATRQLVPRSARPAHNTVLPVPLSARQARGTVLPVRHLARPARHTVLLALHSALPALHTRLLVRRTALRAPRSRLPARLMVVRRTGTAMPARQTARMVRMELTVRMVRTAPRRDGAARITVPDRAGSRFSE